MITMHSWDEIEMRDVERLARRDAEMGALPVLLLIDPSGDIRCISPVTLAATAALLQAAGAGLARQLLQ
jgi:hypothetical protein